MKDNQFYANGRVAVMSNKLLGADKFNRLAECHSIAQALKVLAECNYGGGVAVENNNYEQLLIAESDEAMAILRELCCDKHAVNYFLCRYNYHNAKVLMKRKYMRQSGVDGCFLQTGTDVEKLQEAFVNDDYSQCTKNMAEACDKIDTAFADGNRSPQVIDVCLDKAMYADMHIYATKSTSPLVKQLFVWEVDTQNLMLLYRVKKASQDATALQNWLLENGSIKKQTLLNLWANDTAAEALQPKYKSFYALCTPKNVNLVAAEKAQKSGRNDIVLQNADFLTIQPVLKYFFDKSDEIDKVRSILIQIKNGGIK